MRKRLSSLLLVGTAMVGVMTAISMPAQVAPVHSKSLDVAVAYNAMRSNVTSGGSFWMQGGSVQVHGQFWRGLGVVADVAGTHGSGINASGVGLDLVTATFGPRYTWTPAHTKYSLFGQALAGEAKGFNSIFPDVSGAISSGNSLALQVGGGMNLALSRHLAVRVLEAEWLRTQLPNGTTGVQNNLRLGAGIVFRFR
jgi:peptidoglycan-associated lipoprotein